MAYLGEAIDAHLAAAVGDDPMLLRELHEAFLRSAGRQLDLMRRARCDGNWTMAALRLKGLAASFHAAELAQLAEQALDGAPGDPAVLRRTGALLASLEREP